MALVVPSLAGGGAERVVATMCNHWVRAGHKVTLVTIDGIGSDLYSLDPRVHRLALDMMRPTVGFLASLAANARRVSALRRTLRRSGAEVVLSFVDRTNVLTMAAMVGRRIPVVLAERTDPRVYQLGSLWSRLRNLAYRRADALVVQNPEVAEWGSGLLPRDRIRVIANPVDPARWRVGGEREPRERTILGIGRFSEEKGFDLLISAFAELAPEYPDWSLRILGEGPLRSALEEQIVSLGITDRVALPGFSRDPHPEMRRAGMFVLPSRFEGFPNALLEAMASGCAVVAADCDSGPRHIVTHDVDGLLVTSDSASALATAIRALLTSPASRARLGARAEHVVSRFDVSRVMAEWEVLIATLTGRSDWTTGPADVRDRPHLAH